MLRTRVLIGIALMGCLVLVARIDGAIGYPLVTAVAILLMVVQAQRELLGMLLARGAIVPVALSTLLLFGFVGWGHCEASPVAGPAIPLYLFVAAVAFLGCVEVMRLQRSDGDAAGHMHTLTAGVFSLGYTALPFALLLEAILQRGGEQGPVFAISVVMISKCGDIGGYLVGTFAGRHKMLPRVSPKKSWEGSVGGLVLTVAGVFAVQAWFPGVLPGFAVTTTLLFALVVNVANQAGDFAESMIKRSCGTKDSSALLPTFGGSLDIIDSLLFAIPAALCFIWMTG